MSRRKTHHMSQDCYLNLAHRAAVLVGIVLLLFVTNFGQSSRPTPIPTPHPAIHRWLEIETLTLSTRYRFIENAAGRTVGNAQQWQFIGRGRLKFDRSGRYSAVLGLETGNTFTGGWNNTGIGTGDTQTNIFVKHLYFNAKPIKQIEVQFGGIGFNNGENTEITSYDNDAYLTGERIQIRAPNQLWFDEISLTNGFVGDLNRPSIFHRLRHLDRSNYHQLLVRKKINSRVSFSADYTFDQGADTLRQAVHLNAHELKFIDSLQFENYERIGPHVAYGFALAGTKRFNSKLDLSGGFAKISHQMLNSDRFPQGERIFLITNYKPTKELSISPVIVQAVGPLAASSIPRTRFELIVSYNILSALHRYKIF